MRKIVFSSALMAVCAVVSVGQQNSAPQTARQVLLEMFFSKTPGTFVKHLPEDLLTTGAQGYRDFALLEQAPERNKSLKRPATIQLHFG